MTDGVRGIAALQFKCNKLKTQMGIYILYVYFYFSNLAYQ